MAASPAMEVSAAGDEAGDASLAKGEQGIRDRENAGDGKRPARFGHIGGVEGIAVDFVVDGELGGEPEGESGHDERHARAELHERLCGLSPDVRGPEHPEPADCQLDEHDQEGEGKCLGAYHGANMILAADVRGSKRKLARYNIRVLLRESDTSGWVLKALRECSNIVVRELSVLDEDALRWSPGEGEWCLKEIAAHLRDAEQLALRQMTAITEGRRGPLPAWDIDLLPAERDYRSADLGDLLSEMRELRQEVTYLLWGLDGARLAGERRASVSRRGDRSRRWRGSWRSTTSSTWRRCGG